MGCISFWDAFNENMNAIGLDAPQNLFDSYERAITTLASMVAATQLNPGASALVVFGTEGAATALVGLAAVGASYYTGAVTGSIMIATYKTGLCAMQSRVLTPNDIQAFLHQHQIYDSGLIASEILANPRLAMVA